MKDYFSDLCKNGTISDREFWTTIKLFMSDKGCHENSNLYLLDNGTIVKDEMQVSAIPNEFYVNITKHLTSKTGDNIDLSAEALELDNEQILEKINNKYENHPGDKDIKDNLRIDIVRFR